MHAVLSLVLLYPRIKEHILHEDAVRKTVSVPLPYRPGNEGFRGEVTVPRSLG